ncbi:hypothetical protein EKO04_009626 [Ascochyta lentis]|uniref:4-coumarate-CoA ligase-like protein n=1 Tax=Ascochyta lentis TaxID=205686 RepID=A0A8H7IUJ2_9PLEO|nr:hypothetical protein EKO04_009626 [Ascochyta lentis]
MPHPMLNQHWTRFLHPNAPDPHKDTYTPTNTAIFTSPYGPFPPSPPDLNIHKLCFPPNTPLPPDYPLIINAVTDEVLTLHAFHARTLALSRALRHDGRAEVVFGGVSPESTPFELWWVMRKMQITSMMVHESLLSVLGEAVKLGRGEGDEMALKFVLAEEKVVVLSDDAKLDFVRGYRTVESLIREGMMLQERPRKMLGGDRMAYLFQSSGTSGLPKAMMISHSNGYHSGMQTLITAAQGARFMGMEPFAALSVTLGVIPMYHSYGMILWNLRINLVRNTTILLPKWDLELALRSIEKYKITALPLVPPLIRQLAQSRLTEKYDLSSVIGAVSGAAYLPPDVAYQLAQKLPQGKDMPIPSGYGLSEAASIASPATPGIFGLEPALPGSIGYLLPGMEARVVDPDTIKDVKKGEKGELWARGAVVTPGYFKDAKATADIFTEPGWLRTGDLVMRDEQDRIHYLDRLKEMIKVKGLQVAATEVEDALLQHPEGLVRDACVAGVDNGRGDGSLFVRAWVVVTEEGRRQGGEEVARKMDEWVQGRLSKHKWLTGGVEVVESIPRTPSGKMLRREMRDQYHARLKRNGQAKL